MKCFDSRFLVAPLVVALVLSGCVAGPMSPRESGAVTGAMIGATSGAIIGDASHDAGEGALIGGAVGAIAGAIVGDSVQAQQQRESRDQALVEELRRRDLDARGSDRGVVVNLPDVLFEFGRAELTPAARQKVRTIGDLLLSRGVEWRRVAVEGHTDSVGAQVANQRLSQRRAQAVADALSGLGVAPQRLYVQGFGEAYPAAPNQNRDGSDNPQGRARNRRVEIVILNEVGGPPQPMPPQGYDQYPQNPYDSPYGNYPAPPPPPVYPPYPAYPPGPPPYGY